MPDEDVKDLRDTSDSENSDVDETKGNSQDEADESNGKKSTKPPQNIPYSRFKQVNDEAKQSKAIVDWYRENIGDPNDVVAFKQWKAKQNERAKTDAEDGSLSAEKLAQFKKLMRQADPEYAQFLDQQRMSQEQRTEAQFDEAEELIRDMSKESGFPEEEDVVARIATHVMDEIKSDEKLLRSWQAGHTASVIKKAYSRYMEEFVGKIRPKSDNGKNAIAAKRNLKGLSTLPQGGSSVATSPEKRDPNDRGITKSAHKSAWAYLQEQLDK